MRLKKGVVMKDDLFIKEGIIIPEHELEITASRSGGPGGQHVNKTSTRITIRWNVKNSTALDNDQRQRVLHRLAKELTSNDDIIVHNNESRSQLQNKKMALIQLAEKIRHALKPVKKRIKTKMAKSVKEARLESKKRHSMLKKLRSKKY
jgi:ribosome-associated protein